MIMNPPATASVAAGGTGRANSPSVIFIVYGMATEQSIGSSLYGRDCSGILLMLLYQVTIFSDQA